MKLKVLSAGKINSNMVKPQNIEVSAAIINHIGIHEYYDHLAPLSEIIDVPIVIVDDPTALDLCHKFYPSTKITEIEYRQYTAKYLVTNYDLLIFSSHVQDEHQYFAVQEEQQKKRLYKAFCPHGFSDKTYYWQKYVDKDLTFIYGQNMLDLFEEINTPLSADKYILIGNYRYEYYKKHREHQMKLTQEEIGKNLAMDRKTLFYAPTWPDYYDASTFFESIDVVIRNMPDSFNLIIKAHPRLIHEFTEQYYQSIFKYRDHEQVAFIEEFPLIFPLLELSDFYLGDMSSIGYDFLTFDKPMFFINKEREMHHPGRETFLYRCGTSIDPKNLKNLFSIIDREVKNDKDKFSKIRPEVYSYTFGSPLTSDSVKASFEEKITNWLQN
ncbi:MAG: CDP-glycerol glycerophosphotransferase family protein [Chlamydiota bacterium]|nr:CDP-glycerol glycerophosphotransferase family protein [Chlamydiota bacterium]